MTSDKLADDERARNEEWPQITCCGQGWQRRMESRFCANGSSHTVSPLGERYLGLGATDIPSGDTQTLTVLDFGPVDTNPTETGLLLVLDASRGSIRGGAPSNNETILLTVEH